MTDMGNQLLANMVMALFYKMDSNILRTFFCSLKKQTHISASLLELLFNNMSNRTSHHTMDKQYHHSMGNQYRLLSMDGNIHRTNHIRCIHIPMV